MALVDIGLRATAMPPTSAARRSGDLRAEHDYRECDPAHPGLARRNMSGRRVVGVKYLPDRQRPASVRALATQRLTIMPSRQRLTLRVYLAIEPFRFSIGLIVRNVRPL